jgi:two-component system, cell cycle sensor histidine kinase and response regulator CckA
MALGTGAFAMHQTSSLQTNMTSRAPAQNAIVDVEPDKLRGTETILLVEDQEPVRRAMSLALSKYGYVVLEVECEADALAVAERLQSPIHAIITDVMLPDSDARRMTDRLMAIRPDAKIIYMSAIVENVLRHVQLVDPQYPFLQKPFAVRDLLHKLRAVLGAETVAKVG